MSGRIVKVLFVPKVLAKPLVCFKCADSDISTLLWASSLVFYNSNVSIYICCYQVSVLNIIILYVWGTYLKTSFL